MEKKITEEQLTKIQDQQKELNAILHEIGLLESQKHGLLHKIAEVNQDVETLKNELENQYGAININVEDGTYTEIEKKEEVVENV
mgnify:FL=1|tara:strand:- start:73 stop:327 length:255 start_codon:yes stop_codon:yes gene_type:complete